MPVADVVISMLLKMLTKLEPRVGVASSTTRPWRQDTALITRTKFDDTWCRPCYFIPRIFYARRAGGKRLSKRWRWDENAWLGAAIGGLG